MNFEMNQQVTFDLKTMEVEDMKCHACVTKDYNCGFGYPNGKKLTQFEYVFLTPHASKSTEFRVNSNSYLLSQKTQEVLRFEGNVTGNSTKEQEGKVLNPREVHPLVLISGGSEDGGKAVEGSKTSYYHFKTRGEIIERLLKRP